MINIKIASKTDLAKSVVSFVITGGISKIVRGIAENNTNAETRYQEIEIRAASLAIGAAVSMRVKDYTDACIDQAVNAFQSAKKDDVKLTIVK